jgi:hypothetical protein
MIGGHSGEPAPDIAYEAVRERIVRAAARSRVIRRLNLSNQGLEILPTEIGLLTGLKRLNLNNNRLKRLPAEIGLLAELKFLDLDNNRLTGLPAEIGLLTNLEYLDLDNNRLSGLPARIASLNKLYRLSLAKNVFRTLPKQIGKLRSLQVLDADHNKLNVIPSEIGNLWRLWSLYLADNELSALPVELGRLLRLYTLRLNGNPWPESYLRLIGANEQATARNVLAYLRGEPVPDEPDSEGPSEEQLIAASTEQRPAAYRFGIRDDRVDTLPEAPQPRDGGFATDIYDHAIAKTRALHRRLEHTNSARRVVGSTEGVIEALGIGFSSLRPGLLLSRIRSLEADRAGFDSEVGRVELFPPMRWR